MNIDKPDRDGQTCVRAGYQGLRISRVDRLLMSEIAAPAGRRAAPWLFALTVFTSAALVFMIEPMMARLVLPVLGGSSAVWNTSLAFFQGALLVGYLYAHALQRLTAPRTQVLVHGLVLALAALALPPRVSDLLGDPDPARPALWLLGTLSVSVGAPFAALSATAPLLQAWRDRLTPGEGQAGGGIGPWGLYAASNLGSLLALLAYPVAVEPVLALKSQATAWSLGYLVFFALVLALGAVVWRLGPLSARAPPAAAAAREPAPVLWIDRARWIALAAIPSSLMLGVTTYVTTDVGSAPFLWIAPLALYLATFIIAFQARPIIPPGVARLVQAAAVILACALARPMPLAFMQGLGLHFVCFFFTALVCHQALVARRPASARLTDFYLCLSVGGVAGGAFNAFLAPTLFSTVIEYPAALVLACLARPWGPAGAIRPRTWAALAGCASLVAAAVLLSHPPGRVLNAQVTGLGAGVLFWMLFGLIGTAGVIAFRLRDRAWPFTAAVLAVAIGGAWAGDRVDGIRDWRGFFGVLRESRLNVPGLGGEIRMLAHGTTLHGAQALSPAFRCRPLLYYAHETPIGQVFDAEEAQKPSLTVGAVGLGTGSVAAYDRAGDRFTFFEIDPLVARIATDPRNFSYLSGCARGRIDYVLGDARLTLGRQPPGRFDVLLIDAFSSDSVPAHLLTVEAARLYLSRIKPDGVVILHLSNRSLDLVGPAQAVALAAGGVARFQSHGADPGRPPMWESSEAALIMARSPAGLAPFAADRRWSPADPKGVRPWTDDYTNLFGALVRRLAARPPS